MSEYPWITKSMSCLPYALVVSAVFPVMVWIMYPCLKWRRIMVTYLYCFFYVEEWYKIKVYIYVSSKILTTEKFSVICNSLRPCNADMLQWTLSSLVQIMTCHLFRAKLFPELMLIYCQMDLQQCMLVTFKWKCKVVFQRNAFENVFCKIKASMHSLVFGKSFNNWNWKVVILTI